MPMSDVNLIVSKTVYGPAIRKEPVNCNCVRVSRLRVVLCPLPDT